MEYLEQLNATKKFPFDVVVAAGCATTDTVDSKTMFNKFDGFISGRKE